MKRPILPVLTGACLLASAIAASVTAAPSAAVNPLRVSMYAVGDGLVEVTVTNTSRKAARVPSWQLPSEILLAKQFQVSRDGQPVQYEGPMIKRPLPEARDFTVIQPGRSVSATVDLTAFYDMAKAGDYQVTFASPLQHASLSGGEMLATAQGLPMLLKSPTLSVWTDGGLAKAGTAGKGKPGGGGGSTGSSGATFVGCSSTQITDANNAVLNARGYSEDSKGYLAAGTVGSRYTTWFGAYTSTRYATAKQHFVAIDSAIDQTGGQVTINCGCNQSYYAYVYPTRPYEIFVCRAFWSAPMTGTDSKAGTLIHEMSHFNVVAGTDDHVYGQSGAKNLAISNPDNALDNADNHEYFAENNPRLN